MFFKAPAGTTHLSVPGMDHDQVIRVGDNGVFEASERHLETLKAHGCRPMSDAQNQIQVRDMQIVSAHRGPPTEAQALEARNKFRIEQGQKPMRVARNKQGDSYFEEYDPNKEDAEGKPIQEAEGKPEGEAATDASRSPPPASRRSPRQPEAAT